LLRCCKPPSFLMNKIRSKFTYNEVVFLDHKKASYRVQRVSEQIKGQQQIRFDWDHLLRFEGKGIRALNLREESIQFFPFDLIEAYHETKFLWGFTVQLVNTKLTSTNNTTDGNGKEEVTTSSTNAQDSGKQEKVFKRYLFKSDNIVHLNEAKDRAIRGGLEDVRVGRSATISGGTSRGLLNRASSFFKKPQRVESAPTSPSQPKTQTDVVLPPQSSSTPSSPAPSVRYSMPVGATITPEETKVTENKEEKQHKRSLSMSEETPKVEAEEEWKDPRRAESGKSRKEMRSAIRSVRFSDSVPTEEEIQEDEF